LGAALRVLVVELATGCVRAEVGLVAGELESRRVVVEPPREARVLRVAEVDARVLVAVEALRREGLRLALVLEGPVHDVHGPLGHALPVKAREHAGRAASVEAIAVIQDAQAHKAKLGEPPRERKRYRRSRGYHINPDHVRVSDRAQTNPRLRRAP